MPLRDIVGKTALYGTLGAIVLDTATRAATGEGFAEKLPYGIDVLETLGLIQQKVATDLAQLTQSLDETGRRLYTQWREALGTSAESVQAFESRGQALIDYIHAQINYSKEIGKGAGYVVNTSRNIGFAIAASVGLLIGIAKARYDWLKSNKGQRVKFGSAFKKATFVVPI